MNKIILIKDPIILITLSLDRKRPYCTRQNKIICASLSRYNNPLHRSSATKDLQTLWTPFF